MATTIEEIKYFAQLIWAQMGQRAHRTPGRIAGTLQNELSVISTIITNILRCAEVNEVTAVALHNHVRDVTSAVLSPDYVWYIPRLLDVVGGHDDERLRNIISTIGGDHNTHTGVESIETELQLLVTRWGDQVIFDNGSGTTYGDHRDSDGAHAHRRIIVRTGPVCLDDVRFTGFNMIFDIDVWLLSVRSDYPHEACQGHVHPHVSNGRVCFGTAQFAAEQLCGQGLLHDLFAITESLLHSYNSEGPYVSLVEWRNTGTHYCVICGEELSDDSVDDEDEWDEISGRDVHLSCCSRDINGDHFIPDRFLNPRTSLPLAPCPVCGDHSVLTDLSGIPVCGSCAPLIQEELEAAALGGYICPVCRTNYPAADVAHNRIMINTDDVTCRHCTMIVEINGESVKTIRYPSGDVRVVRPSEPAQYSRPVIAILEPSVCECGHTVAPSLLSHCTITGVTLCPHCDPDGFRVHPSCFTDMAYMDMWLAGFAQQAMTPFTRDYVSLGSAYDFGDSETAARVVKCLITRNIVVPDHLMIEDKCAIINNALEPLGVTLAVAHEEQTHDEEIIRRFREQESACGYRRRFHHRYGIEAPSPA